MGRGSSDDTRGGWWSSTAVSGMEEVCVRESVRGVREREGERERERLCWHLRDVDVEDRGGIHLLGITRGARPHRCQPNMFTVC